jgi:hypothetical protein
MKNKTPKGKTPSLIGSTNGRPKRVTVERKSECNRCKDDIHPGNDCFGIPRLGSGFSNLKRYCKECYSRVLEQTEKDLADLKIL